MSKYGERGITVTANKALIHSMGAAKVHCVKCPHMRVEKAMKQDQAIAELVKELAQDRNNNFYRKRKGHEFSLMFHDNHIALGIDGYTIAVFFNPEVWGDDSE